MKRIDRARFTSALTTSDAGEASSPPAFVIVMAYAVHIGDLALRYLSGHVPVWVIGNGLSAWEADAMKARHGDRLITLSQTYEHAEIIDTLTDMLPAPFWLVDHDCYVLDRSALQAAWGDLADRAGEAWFSTTNAAAGRSVPETFLLRLNPTVIRRLKRRYGVSARKYWWGTLPPAAADRLRAAGLSEASMPEASKDYFDTLRVLALLAEADGAGFGISRDYRAACARHKDVIHIGSTSWPTWPPSDRYSAIGAYFWRLCLEACAMSRAREEYVSHWPGLPTARVMRRDLEESGLLVQGDQALLDFLAVLTHGGPNLEP